MVIIDALSKRYSSQGADVPALVDINLEIQEGEFICLLGPSGCGKSTLLKIIAGLIPSSAGKITINGKPIDGPGPERAVVFQDYALFPWMSVRDNIEFGLEARKLAPPARKEISDKLLSVVGLTDFANRYPHHLSGGMKQRVSIARALAVNPSLLLMDEPFGALDAQTRQTLQDELLRIWREYRKTVIFVTHSIEEAIYLSDRIVVMTARPGRIKEVITVNEARPRDMTGNEMNQRQREVRAVLNEEIERAAVLEQQDIMVGASND
ncbi:NitT/TauT family transport system ATP-binding protein [Nitrobacteraceae bacterium AZCC 2161]|jgi:NitT/TauT family transport system ATP-binding protein